MAGTQNNGLKLAELDQRLATTANDTLNWQAQMRAVVANSIGEIDVQEIVKKQVDRAKAGDVNAAKFILTQVLGAGQAVHVHNTQIITDVETAAKIAAKQRAS